MPDTPRDIVFLDTETLGLHPDAPIWEFAAVRRSAGGGEDRTEFRIQHEPEPWLSRMKSDHRAEYFVADYQRRYNYDDAATESDAAIMMNLVTRGALVIACNPVFDLPRIDKLIIRHGMTPAYHYHPFDITSFAFGAIAGANLISALLLTGTSSLPSMAFKKVGGPPWKSDEVAKLVGVDSTNFARHTAMGDVDWTIAQWDAITGATTGRPEQ